MLLKNTYKNIIPLSLQVEALDLQHIYTKSKPKKKKNWPAAMNFLSFPYLQMINIFLVKSISTSFLGSELPKLQSPFKSLLFL